MAVHVTSPRIVLTGASGFLGSHLHAALLRRDVELCLVTHQRIPSIAGAESAEKVVSVKTPDWIDAVEAFAPNCFVHAATRFQVTHDRSDIPPMVRANVEVGTQLLDLAYHHDARFVTISTAWQLYEGLPRNPMNLYAATKQAFDSIADFYRGEGLDLVRLFLFDVYGPGDTRKKFVPLLMEAARTGAPMHATSGQQLIDLTYVDDVVEAIIGCAMRQSPATTIDSVLKSGTRPVRQVAEVFGDVIGAPVPVIWGAIPDRQKEMRQDWGLEPVLLDWSPTVDLSEGLKRVWEWEGVRDHG